MNLEVILLPFIFSWLWRVAGRGGFQNSLLLRRIVIPYIAYILFKNPIVPLSIFIGACLPIPRKGHKFHDKYYSLTFLVGAVYGISTLNLLYFLATVLLFGSGVILSDYFLEREFYKADIWWLFEYCFGFFLGLALVLSF